jgi:hypothetical protein
MMVTREVDRVQDMVQFLAYLLLPLNRYENICLQRTHQKWRCHQDFACLLAQDRFK